MAREHFVEQLYVTVTSGDERKRRKVRTGLKRQEDTSSQTNKPPAGMHSSSSSTPRAHVVDIQHPGPIDAGKTTLDHEAEEPALISRSPATNIQQPTLHDRHQKYLQIIKYVDELEVGGCPVLDVSSILFQLIMRLEKAAEVNGKTAEQKFGFFTDRINQELAELELPLLP